MLSVLRGYLAVVHDRTSCRGKTVRYTWRSDAFRGGLRRRRAVKMGGLGGWLERVVEEVVKMISRQPDNPLRYATLAGFVGKSPPGCVALWAIFYLSATTAVIIISTSAFDRNAKLQYSYRTRKFAFFLPRFRPPRGRGVVAAVRIWLKRPHLRDKEQTEKFQRHLARHTSSTYCEVCTPYVGAGALGLLCVCVVVLICICRIPR